jgi:hypothetical protein
MAISTATVFECRTSGNATNGGGFVTGAAGTDWSQQDAAQYSVADGVTAGTTTITSATANFGTDVVGNIVYVQGGTGSVAANWYEITARPDANTITVDRATGLTAGTGVTLNIGGAINSVGTYGQILVAASLPSGTVLYVASGTYSMSVASNNVSNGRFSGTTNITSYIIGYKAGSTKNDYSETPLINCSVAGVALTLTNSGNDCVVIANIKVDGTGALGTAFQMSGAAGSLYKCTAVNCTASGFYFFATAQRAISCYASSTVIGFRRDGLYTAVINCWANSCSNNGFGGTAVTSVAVNCLATNCGVGFNGGSVNQIAVNCTAASNTTMGYNLDLGGCFALNCVAANSSTNGFDLNAALPGKAFGINLAGYNNTTNDILGGYFVSDTLALTVDPFKNVAGNDFSPNSAAGGGVDLRGASFSADGLKSYADIGSSQHRDETVAAAFS